MRERLREEIRKVEEKKEKGGKKRKGRRRRNKLVRLKIQ